MRYHFIVVSITLILAACTTNVAPIPTTTLAESQPIKPTATPQPTPTATLFVASATPTSNFGTVAGDVCYPSVETPPMTLYLENIASNEITALDIERGQSHYSITLPIGEYVAYANTVGMHLRGAYLCDSDEPCPFHIEPDQTTTIDLCGWYSPPGIRPPLNEQSDNHVIVKLLQNMNARTGPALSYAELGLVEAGTSLQTIRRSSDGEWLLVEDPDLDITGWLHAPLTQIFGDPYSLPVEVELPDAGLAIEQFTPAIWQSSFNADIVHFKGQIRDEANRPVNGFSILLDNGTWSVLSHPTGASHHYPDVDDGFWDVVIANETDAAGWWTMTVVRYECPDFETGFNAQCKQFTPLSETKVVQVVHPDENVVEANWTCLKNCDEGLYIKAYRRPVDSLPNNLLLYIEDRALKSSPPSPVFDHIEMKTIYDDLPDTPDGLQAYLANNRPKLLKDGQRLIIKGPSGITWLADLVTSELSEINEPIETEAQEKPTAASLVQQGLPPTSTWALSHDQRKVAYSLELGNPLENEIYILDLETQTHELVGPINGYRVPEIRWTAGDELLVIGATNPKFPSGGAIFTMLPEPDTLPEILLESDTAYLVDVLPNQE